MTGLHLVLIGALLYVAAVGLGLVLFTAARIGDEQLDEMLDDLRAARDVEALP